MDSEYFVPEDLKIDSVFISKDDLLKSYQTYKRMPVKQRLEKIASIAGSRDYKGRKAAPATLRKVKKAQRYSFIV